MVCYSDAFRTKKQKKFLRKHTKENVVRISPVPNCMIASGEWDIFGQQWFVTQSNIPESVMHVKYMQIISINRQSSCTHQPRHGRSRHGVWTLSVLFFPLQSKVIGSSSRSQIISQSGLKRFRLEKWRQTTSSISSNIMSYADTACQDGSFMTTAHSS